MQEFVYAKKCILPSPAANVMQSLHMASAFRKAGANVYFFPGVCGKSAGERSSAFDEVLRSQGLSGNEAATWHLVPANHAGVYGLRYRLAANSLLFTLPRALFYARDVGEALSLVRVSDFARRKPRLVFEMHEVLHRQPHNAAKAKALYRAEARILESSAGLVVVSPLLEAMVRDIFGYAKPILVQPNGYSPDLFKPVPLLGPGKPWPVAGESLQLVYLGCFHKGKGVENLVAAMAFLPENVRLRVIGGSPVSKYTALRLQAEAIPGGKRRIEFTGALSQADVGKACADAHIFVIPQDDAAFFSPLKLYEAMAMGLPILATPLTSFTEPRERNLVASALGTSPRDLAEGILALAGNETLARQLRKNALEAAKSATWEARARRILDFCANLP